jgi:hypothetical protein
MPTVTVTGKLHNGRVELDSPIDLPDGSEVYAVAQVGVDKHVAQRRANGWLVDHVGNLVIASDGVFVQSDDRWAWRFYAYLTSLTHAPVGPIGEVDMDANMGDILGDQQTVELIDTRGERFVRSAQPPICGQAHGLTTNWAWGAFLSYPIPVDICQREQGRV